jgi:hypothetical protein
MFFFGDFTFPIYLVLLPKEEKCLDSSPTTKPVNPRANMQIEEKEGHHHHRLVDPYYFTPPSLTAIPHVDMSPEDGWEGNVPAADSEG